MAAIINQAAYDLHLAALAHITIEGRSRLILLAPGRRGFVATTLRRGYEIRQSKALRAHYLRRVAAKVLTLCEEAKRDRQLSRRAPWKNKDRDFGSDLENRHTP